MKRNITHCLNPKYTLALIALAGLPLGMQAQTGSGVLSGNGIRARFNADGSMFWDGKTAMFEVPKGSGKNTISAAALWVGGLDKQGNLHLAAQTYRESGSDFWPGPLDSTASIDSATSAAYNKVWKVTRLQIDSFRAGLSVPQSILDWPGNGDAAKGQMQKLAPFVDVDANGKYEPMKGDYPDIQGDEMIWWVFNDKLKSHTESLGDPLGVEVHGMAWTYDCGGDPAIDKAVFVKYEIFNRSAADYDSVYTALWTDFDIGNLFDDYVGSLPSLNTVFAYNGDDFDRDTTVKAKTDTTAVYNYKGYGKLLPAQALTYIDGIKDAKDNMLGMSKFIYFNNDISVRGNPRFATQFYRYLKGQWLDGSSLTKGGTGYGGTEKTDFAFPGTLEDPNAWTERNLHTAPGDRRAVGSMGPFSLKAGEEKSFTAVYSFHIAGNGKSRESVGLMQQQVQSLVRLYHQKALNGCTGIASCTAGDSCVWPGDANHDGIDEVSDLFNIAYAFGDNGPARTLASSGWNGQKGTNWGQTFPNGVDFHHADANGDGVIDSLDVLPIVLNYGMQHAKKDEVAETMSGNPVMKLNLLEDSALSGSVVHGEISLGSSATPAPNVMGVSFRLTYDSNLVVPGTFSMDISNSDLGTITKLVSVIAQKNGYTDIAIARNDKQGKDLKNIIVKWKYVVEGNVAGYHDSKFKMEQVKVVDPNLKLFNVDIENDNVVVFVTGIKYTPEALDAFVKMYPNPASSVLMLNSERLKIQQVNILNLQGQLIQTVIPNENNIKLDVSAIPEGIYLIEVNTPEGRVVKKFIKSR